MQSYLSGTGVLSADIAVLNTNLLAMNTSLVTHTTVAGYTCAQCAVSAALTGGAATQIFAVRSIFSFFHLFFLESFFSESFFFRVF